MQYSISARLNFKCLISALLNYLSLNRQFPQHFSRFFSFENCRFLTIVYLVLQKTIKLCTITFFEILNFYFSSAFWDRFGLQNITSVIKIAFKVVVNNYYSCISEHWGDLHHWREMWRGCYHLYLQWGPTLCMWK